MVHDEGWMIYFETDMQTELHFKLWNFSTAFLA